MHTNTRPSRSGKRWTVNECNQLHRECELLNMSVAEMATKHNRTSFAIICKLQEENLLSDDVIVEMKKTYYENTIPGSYMHHIDANV